MNLLYRSIFLCAAALATACANSNPMASETLQQLELETYCQDNPNCRRNVQISMETDSGPFETFLTEYWPAVGDSGISLLPGEELFVEVRIEDGIVLGFKQVTEIIDPDRTFTFRFVQEHGIGMMLSVQNPFDQPIKYSIDMIDFQGTSHQTSSCPLVAGGGAFESWPHPIPEIHITNFRVLSESDGFVCRY